jgi:nucleoside-diphosphate-sugar epimerase
MKICVTGASGKAGQAVVAELVAHGYQVHATDLARPAPDSPSDGWKVMFTQADLTDYGQAAEVLAGMDAVVHLANIPAPGMHTPAVTFNQNITMNYNVFSAAAVTDGLSRVVWASSETTLGLPFDTPPKYAPVDEDHYPVPTSSYALSKVASETIARHISAWSGKPFVALRFSNIHTPQDYQELPWAWENPARRRWNLWGYIDARDAAAACRNALEADVTGSQAFIIAAADTTMPRPSEELMREVYPGVELTREVPGRTTLLAIDRAREVLGWSPRHSWNEFVAEKEA